MIKAKSFKSNGPKFARLDTRPRESQGYGKGRGAGWGKIREVVLREAGGLCQCHECRTLGRVEIAHQVDHIDNRRGEGYDDYANLQAINRHCHERKSQLESLIARGLAKRPPHMDRFTRS